MPDATSGGSEELDRFLAAHPDAAHIDAIFVDLCGIVRGKRYPREDAAKLFTSGLQIPITVYLLDVTGDSSDPCGKGFSDGDPDGTALPVPGTLTPVPWAERPSGQVLMHLKEADGTPCPFDPRNVAAAVVEQVAALGLNPVMAFELEFYLLDRERDADGRPQTARSLATGARETSTQVYGIWELDGFARFFGEVEDAARAQGVPASVATAEYAPAQYEINLRHVADPLTAADHCALLRHIVKNVAARHGLQASFLSKPFAGQTGSGMHVHVSLVDKDGRNVFDDGSDLGSDTLRHAIGGMQATMAEAMAIYAPHINAFRRYGTNIFTPVNTSWGTNNRSLTFRIPTGAAAARRIEHRIAGADANPYLVLAALLAGLHHGITNKIDPGPPTEGNAGETADPTIPFTWSEAIDRLAGAEILRGYIDPRYLEVYAAVKRGELAKFNRHISRLEYDWYL